VDVLVVPLGTAGLQVLTDEIVFVLQSAWWNDLAATLDITAELTDSLFPCTAIREGSESGPVR
jgi:hypothetical protein